MLWQLGAGMLGRVERCSMQGRATLTRPPTLSVLAGCGARGGHVGEARSLPASYSLLHKLEARCHTMRASGSSDLYDQMSRYTHRFVQRCRRTTAVPLSPVQPTGCLLPAASSAGVTITIPKFGFGVWGLGFGVWSCASAGRGQVACAWWVRCAEVRTCKYVCVPKRCVCLKCEPGDVFGVHSQAHTASCT